MNGFITWEGGPSLPVEALTEVEVLFKNDTLHYGPAESFCWWHAGENDDDVIAWRLPASKPANTINPAHYKNGKVEAIDAIEAATTGLEGIEAVCTGNILKYIWRWKMKNGIEDLKKARWYLDRLIAKVESGG